jgi:hypothetical protein
MVNAPKQEIKYDPQGDMERSSSIVKGVKDFLLAFDDYNYKSINDQLGQVLKKFKAEFQNPIEHSNGPEFDLRNLTKINYTLEDVKEIKPSSTTLDADIQNTENQQSIAKRHSISQLRRKSLMVPAL